MRTMRVILEVQWGPLASRHAVIEPGESLRVGRTALSDFVIAHDRQMSSRHFELSWDGARCIVRDLGSDEGTWLDGLRVDEGEAKHASWIRAGNTVFMMGIEGAISRIRLPDPPDVAARKDTALATLRAEVTPLFAVLDAARSLRIKELLQESVDERLSLYEGVQGDALADAAPYCVQISKDGELLARLVAEGWGEAFGVFLTSKRPILEVRRHLRRLLMVEAEGERQRLYFRFYDPRVLRRFLPLCNLRQRSELFGTTIQSFFMESEQGDVLRASLLSSNEAE